MRDDEMISPEELAALYVAGALSQQEQEMFEARLAEDADCRKALRSFDATAAALFECIEPVAPTTEIRAQLLSRIAGGSAENQLEANTPKTNPPKIRRALDDAWRHTPIPGISMRILHIDRAARRFSGLFRMEIGAVYPSHVHEQPEEILMLEGDLDFGDYVLEAGDYLRLEAGTTHTEARTQRGCVCLITAELPKALLA